MTVMIYCSSSRTNYTSTLHCHLRDFSIRF